jgi:hypothetical protein
MNTTICLDAVALATMSRDEIFAAMGRADLAVEGVRADVATVAARRRGTATGPAPTSDDTAPCIVLISADHNPLA